MDSVVRSALIGEDTESSKDIVSSSDSLEKLKLGFAKTLEHAEALANRFEQKRADAQQLFRCLNCGKRYKTKQGLQRHWSSKKNKCVEAMGFEVIADINVTPDDRISVSQKDLASKLAKAQKAAREVAYSLNSKKANEGGFDAQRLMRYPVGNFQRALKEADSEDIEEFVQMRFDRLTAPKKVMALAELKKREKLEAK